MPCQQYKQCQQCQQFIARCYLHLWWYFFIDSTFGSKKNCRPQWITTPQIHFCHCNQVLFDLCDWFLKKHSNEFAAGTVPQKKLRKLPKKGNLNGMFLFIAACRRRITDEKLVHLVPRDSDVRPKWFLLLFLKSNCFYNKEFSLFTVTSWQPPPTGVGN